MPTNDQHPEDRSADPTAEWAARPDPPAPEPDGDAARLAEPAATSDPGVTVPPSGFAAWRRRGAGRLAPVVAAAVLVAGATFAGGVAVGHSMGRADAATVSQVGPGGGFGPFGQSQDGARDGGQGMPGFPGGLPPANVPEGGDGSTNTNTNATTTGESV
jgi:hypothetical protein